MMLLLIVVKGEMQTLSPMLVEGRMQTLGPISQFSPMMAGPTTYELERIVVPLPTDTSPFSDTPFSMVPPDAAEVLASARPFSSSISHG